MDEFAAFDYVQLKTGDLACLLWPRGEGRTWAAIVFYAAREVVGARAVSLSSGSFQKLVIDKHVERLRNYSRSLEGVRCIEDPVGGTMVVVAAAEVVSHFSGRRHAHATAGEEPLRGVLPLLGLEAHDVGVSGSTLLGKADPDDLDLIVYDPTLGRRSASAIRTLLASNDSVWLKGYWGRAHHHRRFRLNGASVCMKCPLPLGTPTPWENASPVATSVRFSAVVTDANFGHCAPAQYRVRTLDSAAPLAARDELDVYSNESAHSMAFSVDDAIVVDVPLLCRSTTGGWIATIPMGNPDAMRPGQR